MADILRENDFVSIPTVGSFEREYVEARIDRAENCIHPPSSRILFRSERRFDDGAVVNYCVRNLEMTESVAQQEVTQWGDNVRHRLEEGQSVACYGLGRLYIEDGTIRFERESTPITIFNDFGITPIALPKERSVAVPKRKRKWVRTVAIPLAIVAIIGGTTYLGYYTGANWYTNSMSYIGSLLHTAPAPIDEPIEIVTPVVDVELVDTSKIKLLDSSHIQQNALQYEQHSQRDNARFYLIAGSFSNIENARKQQKAFEKEGYRTEIIENNSMYRVTIAQYSDKNRAMRELMRLRDRKGDSAIWLLKDEEQ